MKDQLFSTMDEKEKRIIDQLEGFQKHSMGLIQASQANVDKFKNKTKQNLEKIQNRITSDVNILRQQVGKNMNSLDSKLKEDFGKISSNFNTLGQTIGQNMNSLDANLKKDFGQLSQNMLSFQNKFVLKDQIQNKLTNAFRKFEQQITNKQIKMFEGPLMAIQQAIQKLQENVAMVHQMKQPSKKKKRSRIKKRRLR